MTKRIAIQGFDGSFHQEAARQFFGKDVQIIPCATFKDLINIALDRNKSDGGIMAIENSIAGTILPNYHLLQKSNLEILGEVYLQIDQNLLVNPGVLLEDIQEVHSHPMALLQCADFLEKYNWKLIATEDTALSAKMIHSNKSKHIAGIAGKLAAQFFHLDILVPNIQTQPNNFTRFWVLGTPNGKDEIPNANKASLLFETDHSKGSLAKVLTQIASCDINLSKLQSMPIPGSDWKYSFHADCEFNQKSQLEEVLEKIATITARVKVYGVYKNGKI
ncbi:MAG: prephenate dehydratase domain-containing protein [Ginsengibacter sp.]|jgi:prephenate dehydratase